jgi:hypothetical protein
MEATNWSMAESLVVDCFGFFVQVELQEDRFEMKDVAVLVLVSSGTTVVLSQYDRF